MKTKTIMTRTIIEITTEINMNLKAELLEFLEANNNFGLDEKDVEPIVDIYLEAYEKKNCQCGEEATAGYDTETDSFICNVCEKPLNS